MKEEFNQILNSTQGLNDIEIKNSREKYGINTLESKKKKSLFLHIISIFKEPMFLLLIAASSIYFIVGEFSDGILMLLFVLVIISIELIQEVKTDRALEELNKLSDINIQVIRNGKKTIISSEEVVVGDIVILEEGDKVPADGRILYSQGLGVNESSLTGESVTVYKSNTEDNVNHFKKNMCYSKTDITNGMGIIEITAVGKNTELGKIGLEIDLVNKEKTPLEKQINKLVLICTIICIFVFILTVLITYFNNTNLIFKERIVLSILSGITIAMATIPEEIPVVLTVFLAMGAWDLTKEKTITRNMKSIETLGAINVLCTDKTGTLTENKMTVVDTYKLSDTFINTMYYSCPIVCYDPMEIAIKNYCQKTNNRYLDKNLTKEFVFTPQTKMMGQIWDEKLLCVKGAYESILPLCNLNANEYQQINDVINNYAKKGYRILAIAKKDNLEDIPESISEVNLSFEGLVALYDPPRMGVSNSIQKCYEAGIRVIMITGDNGLTASNIAKNISLKNTEEVITGEELEKMSDDELYERVKSVNIFARVYPNHKMRIVKSLQKNNQIVAMTGDGVNDAPALKQSNIGIAMGLRGTNVSKESADIILLDDNFNTIIKAIQKGRNIYSNIKKSIEYILAIHIPLALLTLVIPILKLPVFLKPIHVMLLELIIDPTSSIVFQRIKPSKDIMQNKPRKLDDPILNFKNVIISLAQGFLIFLVVLLTYQSIINKGQSQLIAPTVAFSILSLAIMLIAYQYSSNKPTLINFINSFKDKVSLFINLGVLIVLSLYIYLPIFNTIAGSTPLNLKWILLIMGMVLVSVLPFDLLKIKKK